MSDAKAGGVASRLWDRSGQSFVHDIRVDVEIDAWQNDAQRASSTKTQH